MKRSEKRILTTHVGSLIRPQILRDLAPAGQDPTNPEEYDTQLRQAVAAVVKKQAEVGIDIVSDGEYGKASWSAYILKRISGFEIRPDQRRDVIWLGRDRVRFYDAIMKDLPRLKNGVPTEACVGPIKYQDHTGIKRAIDNFQAALQGVAVEEAFLTAVAPASTAYDGVNEYYSSEKDYIYAIADALREEYLAIHKAGLLLQVDDAVLANMYDELVQSSPQRYREWANLRVEALNHALAGIPEDRIRYHVCFGSWHVPHVADAPLEEIVDLIVKVRAGAYSIEAANVRHEHEWRVWETVKLPAGRSLIPGVITHHTVTVEHPRLVADRIVRFARLVGRENVIAGSDCGFAQSESIERVHPTVMWAKFESLVAGAQLASKELW
jgi:5-methyltetrahydropteroyltriglutamate--homocysteine methyltransferase